MEPYTQIVAEVYPGEEVGVETGVFYPIRAVHIELVYANRSDPSQTFSLLRDLGQHGHKDHGIEIQSTIPEDQLPGDYFCQSMIVTTQEGKKLEAESVPHETFGIRVKEKPSPPIANGWRVFQPNG